MCAANPPQMPLHFMFAHLHRPVSWALPIPFSRLAGTAHVRIRLLVLEKVLLGRRMQRTVANPYGSIKRYHCHPDEYRWARKASVIFKAPRGCHCGDCGCARVDLAALPLTCSYVVRRCLPCFSVSLSCMRHAQEPRLLPNQRMHPVQASFWDIWDTVGLGGECSGGSGAGGATTSSDGEGGEAGEGTAGAAPGDEGAAGPTLAVPGSGVSGGATSQSAQGWREGGRGEVGVVQAKGGSNTVAQSQVCGDHISGRLRDSRILGPVCS